MNKSKINKHKDVIKWFCDNVDNGVWFRYSSEWKLIYETDFPLKNEIVQNDEYADLRKAQADGKVIQLDTVLQLEEYSDYIDMTDKDIFNFNPACYRIKPDEPTLKVGDWVEITTCDTPRIIKRVIKATKGFDTVTIEGNGNVGIVLIRDLKLWKPKKGEWCVFGNNQYGYIIGTFIDMNPNDGWFNYNCKNMELKTKTCYPLEFIQTLKATNAT